jgi:Bacterial SH3 domain
MKPISLTSSSVKALMGLALVPSLLVPFAPPAWAQTSNYRCNSNFRQIIQSGARSVSVFESPSQVNPRVIGEIDRDEVVLVTLTDRSGTFAEIETTRGLKGWIYASKLHPVPGEVTRFNGFLQVRAISSPRVNFRTDASRQASVIDKLATGTIVRYGNTVGEWVYVTDSTGRSGYIANPYLVCTTARFTLRSGPDRN